MKLKIKIYGNIYQKIKKIRDKKPSLKEESKTMKMIMNVMKIISHPPPPFYFYNYNFK